MSRRKKKAKFPLPITPLDEALKIEMPSPEEQERLKKMKKVDADDLVHELGAAGFSNWLNKSKTVCVHHSESEVMPISRMLRLYPRMRPPIIDGLLRRGEIMNVISAPKTYKSIMVMNMVMSIISGGRFMDRFQCAKGRCLVIDNELHCETIAQRIREVALGFNIPLDRVGRMVDYIPLRGALVNLVSLAQKLDSIRAGEYKLIILDAFYKFMPEKIDENSNADMANLYNLLDSYADQVDSAIVLIHHTSKGGQSGKEVTDVGAGAGAQSRAADTHMVLIPLNPKGAVRVDAAVRSFAPLQPFGARIEYPRWRSDETLDINDVKVSESQQKNQSRRAEREQRVERGVELREALVEKITSPMTSSQIQQLGAGLGITEKWSTPLVGDWLKQAVGRGVLVMTRERRGGTPSLYIKASLAKSSVSAPESTDADISSNDTIIEGIDD